MIVDPNQVSRTQPFGNVYVPPLTEVLYPYWKLTPLPGVTASIAYAVPAAVDCLMITPAFAHGSVFDCDVTRAVIVNPPERGCDT